MVEEIGCLWNWRRPMSRATAPPDLTSDQLKPAHRRERLVRWGHPSICRHCRTTQRQVPKGLARLWRWRKPAVADRACRTPPAAEFAPHWPADTSVDVTSSQVPEVQGSLPHLAVVRLGGKLKRAYPRALHRPFILGDASQCPRAYRCSAAGFLFTVSAGAAPPAAARRRQGGIGCTRWPEFRGLNRDGASAPRPAF